MDLLNLGLNLNPVKPSDFSLDLGLGGRKGSQRAEWRKPLEPADEQSLANKALGAGLSGLSYIGGTLDKPGQAVRGLLAGKGARSLLHLVPFSHTMGLTTDNDQTSGRDLTDMAGLTSKGDKGWGAWGAGLAADMMTDPLSYGTFGAKHALTAAGQAAKAAGTINGLSRAEMIRRGYSGLMGIGVPFKAPSAVVGTGRIAQRIAGALDTAGDWAKFRNPLGRSLNALFDPSVGGAVDEITQRGWRTYGDPALTAEKRIARGHQADVLQAIDPLVTAHPHAESDITNAIGALVEGVPTVSNYSPHLLSQVQGVAGTIGARNDEIMRQAREIGLPVQHLDDTYANYLHKQATAADAGGLQLADRGNLYPVGSGSTVGREEVYRNIPGGKYRINDWYRRFAGEQNVAAIHAAVRHDLEQDLLAHAGGHTLTPAVAQQLDDKAVAMSERLAAANPRYRATANSPGLDFYTPNIAATETQRSMQHARNMASARAAIGTLGDVAQPFTNNGTMTTLPEVIRRLGLQTYGANRAAGTPIQGALIAAHEILAHRFGLAAPNLNGRLRNLRNVVGQYGVTNEHAEQILKAYQKWAAPEELKGPLRFLDSINNLFKPLAYSVWFPSHVRNAGTAAGNNLRSGVLPFGHHMKEAKQIIEGTIDPSLLGKYGLGDLNQARREAYASAGIFGGHNYHNDVAANALTALTSPTPGRFTPHAPGAGRPDNLIADTLLGIPAGWLNTGRAAGQAIRDVAQNPRGWRNALAENLGIRGVGGVERDALPAIAAGRRVGTNIEDTFRLAQWLAEREKGATANAAADVVNKTHFDYDALTNFEKNVMRRVVPFYTYARKNLPLQIETALHTPAWTQAQIKPFNQPDQERGYVPDYLQSGVAVPVGPEANGTRRYISKLGLPVEEAFERLHFQNGLPDIRKTALDFMGQLNPVLKGPLEQLFDTQFHTQRKLSDLHAPAAASAIGRLFNDDNPQLLSQALANSPLTRFVTSADKLLDNRKDWLTKAVNLGTGVRVTDVDTDKQRAIDTRNALEEILRGQPHLSQHTTFYVRPGQGENLTPQEMELMRLYSTLQQHALEYAKNQRQKIGVSPK
jgi:hypothetical protein